MAQEFCETAKRIARSASDRAPLEAVVAFIWHKRRCTQCDSIFSCMNPTHSAQQLSQDHKLRPPGITAESFWMIQRAKRPCAALAIGLLRQA